VTQLADRNLALAAGSTVVHSDAMDDTRSPDENELASLDRSTILTDAGWEEAEYIEPERDWRLMDDGSYLSPDGRIRSWPLAGPEPL
jgi:hypothetical protein